MDYGELSTARSRFWGLVAVAVLAMTWMALSAVPAHAASASIAVSADPTEEKNVVFTISGQAEANRSLWVAVFPNANHDCSYTSAWKMAYDAPMRTVVLNGDALSTGPYERTANFVPPGTGGYLVCAIVSQDLYSTPVVRSNQTFEARQPTATSSIAVSADPTEEKPVTVTLSGQTEVDRSLWVVAFPNTYADYCESDDIDDLVYRSRGGTILLNQDPIGAGSFRRTATFTPPSAGSYRICAFVSEDRYSVPNAKGAKIFSARAPKATSRIEVSAGSVVGRPATATITGQTEVDRHLWVVAFPYATSSCESSNARTLVNASEGTDLIVDDEVTAGSYRRTVALTPTRPGTQRICAYVAEDEYSVPNVISSADFEARRTRAIISIAPEGSLQHLAEGAFLAKGFTEASGELLGYINYEADACDAGPDPDTIGTGYRVNAGAFTWRTSVVLRTAGSILLCAYVVDSQGEVIGATSAKASVERDPTFMPKLLSPNGKVGHGVWPSLKWKTGPGRDSLEFFFKKPKSANSRGFEAKRRAVKFFGGEALGFRRVTFKRSYIWDRGRIWWRVVREDPESGYSEVSRPRYFINAPSRR